MQPEYYIFLFTPPPPQHEGSKVHVIMGVYTADIHCMCQISFYVL